MNEQELPSGDTFQQQKQKEYSTSQQVLYHKR